MKGKLFIVSAPSCGGKTTLVEKVLQSSLGKKINRYVTYTTKSPRKGDLHGKDFYFVFQEKFLQLVEENFFIEWSNAYCHYYGTPYGIKNDLMKGESYILILDRAGTKKILQKIPEAVTIWISVSSIKEIERRMEERGGDNYQQKILRLYLARKEIDEERNNPMYKFHIINDDFAIAYKNLVSIIEKNIK